MEEEAEDQSQAIVLHEDKQYYPSALQVYGEEVIGYWNRDTGMVHN